MAASAACCPTQCPHRTTAGGCGNNSVTTNDATLRRLYSGRHCVCPLSLQGTFLQHTSGRRPGGSHDWLQRLCQLCGELPMSKGHDMQAWSRLAHTGSQPGVCYLCLSFVYGQALGGGGREGPQGGALSAGMLCCLRPAAVWGKGGPLICVCLGEKGRARGMHGVLPLLLPESANLCYVVSQP